MRFAFDTNVLISSLLIGDSVPAMAVAKAESNGVILYSISVLEEIAEVLSRSKFSKYIDADEIEGFLARIVRCWEKIVIMQNVSICRDHKDNKFLELAINGLADFLITGDKDLLSLRSYGGIPIITPTEFMEIK